MNYVGIRGHRGSGKKSFAALLGNTMDILLSYPPTYMHYDRDTRSAFDNNYDELSEYEEKCAQKIRAKKADLQEEEIRQYLYRKGYKID